MLDFEKQDMMYFRDERPGDFMKRQLRGTTSVIDNMKQYVDYQITVSHFSHSQGFAGRLNEDFTYHIFAEVGRHEDVEALLNNIAANAGVGTVKAFA